MSIKILIFWICSIFLSVQIKPDIITQARGTLSALPISLVFVDPEPSGTVISIWIGKFQIKMKMHPITNLDTFIR